MGTCWEKIDEMLANQFGEIQSSFGRSVTVLENRYKDVTLYSGLGGHMSRQAMNFIFVEEERARKTLCIEKRTCGCVQRTSYDLPCACLISVKKELNRLYILGTLITLFASYLAKSSQILKNHSIMLFTSNANSL